MICVLNQFSVIKVTGDDAISFLQGQVTADMPQVKQQHQLAGCHLNAKGKMWSTFVAYSQNDAIYLIMTKESAEQSLAEMKKYAVFSKCELEDISDSVNVYGTNSEPENGYSLKLANNHYLVISEQNIETDTDNSDLWWFNEVMSARAHIYSATSSEYVPQMLNLQALDYISFNKGCYMGQEMVARMRYLGKNKRALFIGQADSELDCAVGDNVYIEVNGNKRKSGTVINKQYYQGKTAVQIVLPNDSELDQTIYCGEQQQAVTLSPLPYELT